MTRLRVAPSRGPVLSEDAKALLAVIRLHKPLNVWMVRDILTRSAHGRYRPPDDDPQRKPDDVRCSACWVHNGTLLGYQIYEPYPCPTLRAIRRALGSGGPVPTRREVLR